MNNTGTKKVALWNKRHFEEKNGECAACLKYSVLIFVEKIYIKCNIWRVAVRPSYIQDAQFLKVNWTTCSPNNCRSYGQKIGTSWWQLTLYCNWSPYSLTKLCTRFPTQLPVSALSPVHLYSSNFILRHGFHRLAICVSWSLLNSTKGGQHWQVSI